MNWRAIQTAQSLLAWAEMIKGGNAGPPLLLVYGTGAQGECQESKSPSRVIASWVLQLPCCQRTALSCSVVDRQCLADNSSGPDQKRTVMGDDCRCPRLPVIAIPKQPTHIGKNNWNSLLSAQVSVYHATQVSHDTSREVVPDLVALIGNLNVLGSKDSLPPG